MAALQTLRNKAAIFITVLIALALLAFIMTDLLGSSSIFGNSTTVGVIDGTSVNIMDFEQELRASEQFAEMNSGRSLTEDEQNQSRENTWQKKIVDITFGNLYQNAGIEVTGDELLDMVTGTHIAPYLRQIFADPQTGVYNRAAAENFLRTKNERPEAAFFWHNIEASLKSERLMNKYTNLVRQSYYCNRAQIEVEKAKRGTCYDVNFVGVRYALIPDSTIAVSDSEISARFKQNKEMYKVEGGRDIEYVSFPIRPTNEDREDIRRELESLKSDFADPETDAVSYAQMNAETPSTPTFQTSAQLTSKLADFVQGAQVGDVYGPYLEGNTFCLSRLAAVASRPDSVKARHILIQGDDNLADSLLKVAKSGANFAELARKYSKDNGSAINGGDLGWFADGVMVPEFNEACFTNPKGTITMVKSQYGNHIIEVQDRGVETKKYKLATIDKSIQYSSRTTQAVYSEAQAFATSVHDAQSFDAYVDTTGLVKRIGRNIRSNANTVNSSKHARDLVKWAYNASVGEVSPIHSCTDEFVVAILKKETEKGYANIADVEPAIARQLRNQKKAEIIEKETQGKSLAQVAEMYNTKIDSAHHVTFASNSIVGAGVEPALVGKITALEQGQVYSAVEGSNGAYIVEVVSSHSEQVSDDQIRVAYMQTAQNFQYALYQYVTDVEIEDNRIKFY